MKQTLFILFTLLGLQLNAQEYQYPETTVGFLVIYSTNDFDKAHILGQKSADSLNTDFSECYIFDQEEGLIDTTTCGCGTQHGYIPRGRFDFESDSGTYVVIACGYPISFEELGFQLEKIKTFYPDALYFERDIYTGCMH